MSTSNVLSPVSPSGESEIQSTLVLPDELTFTVVTASNRQPLGKRYWLSGSGELETETAVPLASGEVAVGRLATHLGIVAGLGLVYALARAERALPPDLPAAVVDDAPGREQGPGLRGVA